MHRTKKILSVVMFVVAAGAVFAAGSVAAPKARCMLEPFSFSMPAQEGGNRPTDNAVRAEWRVRGTTNADCGGTQFVGIDVWEHAVVMFPAGGGPVRGRVDGFMVWNGETVSHFGQMRGNAVCNGNECTLELEIRSNGANGAKLVAHERASLMVGAGAGNDTLQSLDVLSSVFKPGGRGR